VTIRISQHAFERGEQRLNLRPESLIRLAQSAMDTGLQHADARGSFKRYLDKLFLSEGKANNLRVYGDVLFLFHNEVLVTVFAVPREYRATVAKLRAREGVKDSNGDGHKTCHLSNSRCNRNTSPTSRETTL
jgi:hypothetical protein